MPFFTAGFFRRNGAVGRRLAKVMQEIQFMMQRVW